MKVVCINNITTSEWEEGEIKTDLVIGGIYNVIGDGDEYYEIETGDSEVIINNNIGVLPRPYAIFYKKDMFQKLEDWRDDKLNILGI